MEYLEVDNDDSDGVIEQALEEIDFGLDDTVIMNGNDIILGHYYWFGRGAQAPCLIYHVSVLRPSTR